MIERDNRDAARAVAFTLLSLEQYSEAESYLRELLVRQPTDGPLNRALARIHVARGEETDARTDYQRAIYGEWPQPASVERLATRFELIDYLRRLGAHDEVLAELIRIKAEIPATDTPTIRRVADLLWDQDAPALAIQTLQAAATASPADTQLLAQLADLQLRQRQIADAAATLRRAAAIEPAHAEIGERLRVVDRILALDPTLPGLRLGTRTRRARLVLQAVLAEVHECVGNAPATEARSSLEDAAKRVRERAPASAEQAEHDLETADALWKLFATCHEKTVEAQALTRVLEHVGTDAGPT